MPNVGSNNRRVPNVDFNVSKLNMQMIGTNKVIVFIGMRGMGKSTLLLDYLYHNQDIPFITCISPTDEYNETFKPHIPGIFIYDKYTEEIGANVLKRQKEITKKVNDAKKGIGDPRYLNVDPRGAIIFDDCLADAKSWLRDDNILWMFMNGRHVNLTFILTMQYVMGITPNLRTNVDWVFMCRDSKTSNKRKLLEHYCGIFENYEFFDQVFDACTTDHSALAVHNSSKSQSKEDAVFWYKAELHGDFRLCYDIFWQYQDYQAATDNRHPLERTADRSSDEPAYKQALAHRNRINFIVQKRE